MKLLGEARMETRPHKGVFWLIDGAIWAVPFDDKKYECVSKNNIKYLNNMCTKKYGKL